MLRLSQIWPVGAPSSGFLCPFDKPPSFFKYFFAWNIKMFQVHLVFSLPRVGVSSSFREHWFLLVRDSVAEAGVWCWVCSVLPWLLGLCVDRARKWAVLTPHLFLSLSPTLYAKLWIDTKCHWFWPSAVGFILATFLFCNSLLSQWEILVPSVLNVFTHLLNLPESSAQTWGPGSGEFHKGVRRRDF